MKPVKVPRWARHGSPRFIMENGAKGVEVIISGKLRAQRAKAMKFRPFRRTLSFLCCGVQVY